MTQNHTIKRPVYRALNRPLTIAGVERRLFFLALLLGSAAFNLFYSFVAGLLTFATLYALAFAATKRDPKMLQILLVSARFSRRFDPAKHVPVAVEVRPC